VKEYERVALTKDRLREAMRTAGMKQADLVRETGLNRGTISRYLSGEVEPRQVAAHKLAVALGVSEMWLFGYEVPMPRSPESKKNDELVQVFKKLRKDPEFFEVVSMLADLSESEYASVKSIISALRKK
jgi:repressor LexA